MAKWKLWESGRKPTEGFTAALRYLKWQFPLCRDSELREITGEEYATLVAAGEIDPPTAYWKIDLGETGAVHLDSYSDNKNTWGRAGIALGDFISGWAELARRQAVQAAHSEALLLNAQWDKEEATLRRWGWNPGPYYSDACKPTRTEVHEACKTTRTEVHEALRNFYLVWDEAKKLDRKYSLDRERR